MARAADWLIPRAAGTARAALVALIAVAWLWLASFYVNYYVFIERTGDESHMTFRTASVERKATVLQHIQSQRDLGSPAWIVSQEWWSFYPLEYLASADRELHDVRRGRCECGNHLLRCKLPCATAGCGVRCGIPGIGLLPAP